MACKIGAGIAMTGSDAQHHRQLSRCSAACRQIAASAETLQMPKHQLPQDLCTAACMSCQPHTDAATCALQVEAQKEKERKDEEAAEEEAARRKEELRQAELAQLDVSLPS